MCENRSLGKNVEIIDFGSQMWKTLIFGQKCEKHRFWVKKVENSDFWSKVWRPSILVQHVKKIVDFW